MITIESKLREWGRSTGLVIPKEAIDREQLKNGDSVEIIIIKKQMH